MDYPEFAIYYSNMIPNAAFFMFLLSILLAVSGTASSVWRLGFWKSLGLIFGVVVLCLTAFLVFLVIDTQRTLAAPFVISLLGGVFGGPFVVFWHRSTRNDPKSYFAKRLLLIALFIAVFSAIVIRASILRWELVTDFQERHRKESSLSSRIERESKGVSEEK